MKARAFLPEKLDVKAFIEAQAPLQGDVALSDMPRLASSAFSADSLGDLPPVRWQATGRLVRQRVGEPELWLDLQAEAVLDMECQRCLQAVRETVSVSRAIRFARDEAEAARLDAESEDDVLAVARQFHLLELIEDELIMALPIVPRHAQCPTDVSQLMHDEQETPVPGAPQGGDPAEPVAEKPHPFAALAALKKRSDT
jgi:uncharacterized protein